MTSERVEALFEYLTREEHGDYIGEDISQLEHALQCAWLATEAKSDEDTILAALLHDIGQFLPRSKETPSIISPSGNFVGRGSHDVIGEEYLRDFGFSEKVCKLVGGHVIAKRYLTAVDPQYYDKLSSASKITLKYQGGPMSSDEVRQAQQDPWLKEKLQIRQWDDLAKDPNMNAPEISNYVDMAVRNIQQTTIIA
jgi:predicted HD phosphohydrolase